MTIKRALLATAVTAITMSLAFTGCSSNSPLASPSSSSTPASGSIVVGSANFPESELLATIYAQALQQAGVKVTTKLNIGSREVYFPALLDGSIDLLPEYTGATLSYLDTSSSVSSPADVQAALKKALPPGITMLTPSNAQDSDVLAVTKATAQKYSLTSISDLAPYASSLVLGGPPEWKTRKEGVQGLSDVYGLQFKTFKSLDVAGPLTLAALKNGQIDAGDMTSTDPAMKDLVALKDDKNLFAAQNIVPIINESKASSTVTKTLDAVSAALVTADLVTMNDRISNGKESIDTVAADWLAKHPIS